MPLTITSANVELASSNRPITKQAGEAISAGTPVYLDTTTNKVMAADVSATASAQVIGVALTNANADEDYIAIVNAGDIVSGGTMVKGQMYYALQSGGVGLFSDLISGDEVTAIYRAISTSVARVNVEVSGVEL